jgi:hypothetical protein
MRRATVGRQINRNNDNRNRDGNDNKRHIQSYRWSNSRRVRKLGRIE